MNKFSLQPLSPVSSVAADEAPITTSNYQAPTIEVFNPNELAQGTAEKISESNSGYYSEQ